MRKIVRNTMGVLFIVLGILGFFLPILQGWLFLGVGALLLSIDLPFFAKMVRWIEEKFPRLKEPLDRARRFLKGPDEDE